MHSSVSSSSAVIVPLTSEHAEQVLAIYQAGIEEGNATFETSAPTWEAFEAAKLPEHRFAALDADGAVLGWVAATKVSDRCAYAGVVEHSVYVHPGARGRGVASALLKALIDSTEAAGIWTIQSGIFPENTASIALHERAWPSASSAPASASAATTASGATWSCWNVAAHGSADPVGSAFIMACQLSVGALDCCNARSRVVCHRVPLAFSRRRGGAGRRSALRSGRLDHG